MIGQRLGPYEITAKLGEGGMGEVYRATDSRLKREVAIKVLPAAFTEDRERLSRFEREAQLLAQLHHPNIASIFGLEESGGVKALIMELVDGPTLAERLESGPLSFTESFSFALQIAQALEEAHEKGIVHRDLKPQNVKASSEGKAKVLDFGLAKAMDATPGAASAADLARSPTIMNSPTLTAAHGTQLGVILGTAAYMAPEQARGGTVDKRADIWAFGVVLYEMLTGRSLFAGPTVSDTLAGVLKTAIDFAELPADTPPAIRRLLRRCLERNPKNRLHDIADARIVLQESIAGTGEPEAAQERTVGVGWRSPARLAAGAATLLAVGVAGGWIFGSRSAESGGGAVGASRDPVRFSIRPPAGVVEVMNPQVSSAGDLVLYQGWRRDDSGRLYSHRLADGVSRAVDGTEGGVDPFLSPDGRWVGYRKDNGLFKSPLAGGDRLTICPDCRVASGSAWLDDGTILYNNAWLGGLSIVSADGGSPRVVTQPDAAAGERGHWFPNRLPGGRFALFTIFPSQSGINDAWIAVLDLGTGAYRRLVHGADAHFLAPRHLIFYRGGAYHAVEFDLSSGTVVGEPAKVVDDATEHDPSGDNRRPLFAGGGLLVYRPGALHDLSELAWLRRGRAPEPLRIPARPWVQLALSPDGKELLGSVLEGGAFALRRVALDSGSEERLSLQGMNWKPRWRPDGAGIVFRTMRKGDYDTYWLDLVAGGAAQPVLESPSDETPIAWTPDGKNLLAEISQADGSYPLLLHPLDGGKDRIVVDQPFDPDEAAVSPDGNWLAFASSHSGTKETYAQPLDGKGAAQRVSRRGGASPSWSTDGRWIYYVAGKKILRVAVRATGPRLDVGEEETIAEGNFVAISPAFAGTEQERFLVALGPPVEPPVELRVIMGFQREIEVKMAQEHR